MNLRWILVLIIFAATTVSAFYFQIKAGCIRNKYLNWKDIFQFRVREKIPEHEWRRIAKYQLRGFLCLVGGIVLILLLYVL